MHHDHRGFDQTDPDASQALEHALPIVADLLTERAKPQPKDVDLLRAWRNQISDLQEQLSLVADRGGLEVAELEQLATARLRRRTQSATVVAAPVTPSVDPNSFEAMAAEALRLEQIGAGLQAEYERIGRALKGNRLAINGVRRKMVRYGTRRHSRA